MMCPVFRIQYVWHAMYLVYIACLIPGIIELVSTDHRAGSLEDEESESARTLGTGLCCVLHVDVGPIHYLVWSPVNSTVLRVLLYRVPLNICYHSYWYTLVLYNTVLLV